MKQHLGLLLVAMGFFAASCNTQEIAADKVPAVVVNTLNSAFPNAAGVEWEKKGTFYEADLDDTTGADIAVLIDASGKTQMLKRELATTALPAAIVTSLQNQYKDFEVDEVEVIEKEGALFYQVELNGKGLKSLKDKKLVLNAKATEVTGMDYWD